MTYLAAVLALVLSPGPNLAIVLGNATAGGRSAGLATVAGILAGFACYALASAIGLASLLTAAPAVLDTLRYIGGGYLVWLGFRNLVRIRRSIPPTAVSLADAQRAPTAFRDGLVTNLLNPKVVLFYVAVVPSFVDPGASVVGGVLMLAGIHAAVAGTWFVLVTLLVHHLTPLLRSPRAFRAVSAVTGVALLIFGVRLLALPA